METLHIDFVNFLSHPPCLQKPNYTSLTRAIASLAIPHLMFRLQGHFLTLSQGCVCVCVCVCVCIRTLSNNLPRLCVCVVSLSNSLRPMECSLPGSSAHGIFQSRIPEWVVVSYSTRLSKRIK